jgi:hypothetical protein
MSIAVVLVQRIYCGEEKGVGGKKKGSGVVSCPILRMPVRIPIVLFAELKLYGIHDGEGLFA